MAFQDTTVDFLLDRGLFEDCLDEQEIFIAGPKDCFGDIRLFEIVDHLVDVTAEIGYFDRVVEVGRKALA
jgi:hypothetical protein